MRKMRESELFPAVKRLFEENGYSVNAEVCGCDVTAVKDGRITVVELKKNLSVTLLAQGLARQKLGSLVYIAVPKPKNYSPKKFKPTLDVIKKMELGLIFVTFSDGASFAEAVTDPEPYRGFSVNSRKKKKVAAEIEGRSFDVNTGGVCHRKIATAYTEKCVFAALLMMRFGDMTPKQLREHGADENIGRIMSYNAYHWFRRTSHGVYGITDECENGLNEYPELCEYLRAKIDKEP